MLEIYLQTEELFKFEEENTKIYYKDVDNTMKQGAKIKFSFDKKVGELKELIWKELGINAAA